MEDKTRRGCRWRSDGCVRKSRLGPFRLGREDELAIPAEAPSCRGLASRFCVWGGGLKPAPGAGVSVSCAVLLSDGAVVGLLAQDLTPDAGLPLCVCVVLLAVVGSCLLCAHGFTSFCEFL